MDSRPGSDSPSSSAGAGPAHSAADAGASQSDKEGMSTGAKFLIGCLGIVGVLAVAGAIGSYVLYNYIGDRGREFVGGLEQQAEAQQVMERLEEEHPFEPPSDGVVSEASARALFDVTDEVWSEVQPWAEELADVARRVEERDQPSVADLTLGPRLISRLAEGRVLFAETLDQHDLAPQEYLWTGYTLLRAYEELDRPEEERTSPPENLELAERYRAELEELNRPAVDGRPARGSVFYVASLWGLTSEQ